MSSKSLKESIAEEVGAGELSLPVFNRTALQLKQLTDSETVEIDKIAKVLMQDQALASRLLMLANSAYYQGLRQVDTVSAAIVRLGTKRVANMAVVAGQAMAYQSTNPLVSARLPTLWKRSFLSAAGCEWLCKQFNLGVDPESAFICGLLHDVGELYLLKVVEKLVASSKSATDVTPALLDEILEAMHNQIGHDVMLQWGLPEKFARAARDHHAAEFDTNDVHLTLCRLLDQAILKLGVDREPAADIELAATLEAQVLGLSDIQLAQLEIFLEDALPKAAEMQQ